MPPSSPTQESGTRIGVYQVCGVRGEGGMGVVYEAVHTLLNKRVAIKMMRPEFRGDPRLVERFFREGQAAAAIRHPHVIQIFDVGYHGSQPYLVMDFLEGEDLAHRLTRLGRLPARAACDLMLPILAGVAAAHDRGVVHRDLKPENIFLDQGGDGLEHPRVVDFGISRLPQTSTVTRTIAGTPAYMSPEQYQGSTPPATDQFALGVMLYQLCTGVLPFDAPTAHGMMFNTCNVAPVPPRQRCPELPAALEVVILRALRKEPAERYPGLRQMGAALLPLCSPAARARFAAEFPSLSGEQGSVADGDDAGRPRRRWALVVLVLGGVGGLALALGGSWGKGLAARPDAGVRQHDLAEADRRPADLGSQLRGNAPGGPAGVSVAGRPDAGSTPAAGPGADPAGRPTASSHAVGEPRRESGEPRRLPPKSGAGKLASGTSAAKRPLFESSAGRPKAPQPGPSRAGTAGGLLDRGR